MKTRTLTPLPAEQQEEGGWPPVDVMPDAAENSLVHDPDGEDLLCGHCHNVIYEKIVNQGMVHIRGLKCPHCGGRNILDA